MNLIFEASKLARKDTRSVRNFLRRNPHHLTQASDLSAKVGEFAALSYLIQVLDKNPSIVNRLKWERVLKRYRDMEFPPREIAEQLNNIETPAERRRKKFEAYLETITRPELMWRKELYYSECTPFHIYSPNLRVWLIGGPCDAEAALFKLGWPVVFGEPPDFTEAELEVMCQQSKHNLMEWESSHSGTPKS